MAIDTRQKRFSMLNFGSGAHLSVLFEADGAVDLDDRQHLLDCYSGIKFRRVRLVSTKNILTLRKLREDNERRRAELRPQRPIMFRLACSIQRLLSIGSGSAPVVGERDFDGHWGILSGAGK